jgi:1-acyl-sn-glycerol-3-phosphate acyltransferase
LRFLHDGSFQFRILAYQKVATGDYFAPIDDNGGFVWKLRSVLFSIPAIALATIVMAMISITCSLWDKVGYAQHTIARIWSRMLMAFGAVRCKAFGTDKLDPSKSYVLVSNHASYMDTPAIVSSLPLQFRFFAKKGLFSIPFLGWHLARAGHIPVIRGDARASLKNMSEGAKLMRERNISLLLFPEGGRTPVGMRPFKEGAAYIAIKAGVPIVPIGLIRTRDVLPMHTLVIRPGTVEVHVGDPIPTADLTLRDRGRLNEILERKVAELAGEQPPVHVDAPASVN